MVEVGMGMKNDQSIHFEIYVFWFFYTPLLILNIFLQKPWNMGDLKINQNLFYWKQKIYVSSLYKSIIPIFSFHKQYFQWRAWNLQQNQLSNPTRILKNNIHDS